MSVDRAEAHRLLDALLESGNAAETFARLTSLCKCIAPTLDAFQTEWDRSRAEHIDDPDAERLADLECIARVLLVIAPLLPQERDIARNAANDILRKLPVGDDRLALFRLAPPTGGRPERMDTKAWRDLVAEAVCFGAAAAGITSKAEAIRMLKYDDRATPAAIVSWIAALRPSRLDELAAIGGMHARGEPMSSNQEEVRTRCMRTLEETDDQILFRHAAGGDTKKKARRLSR